MNTEVLEALDTLLTSDWFAVPVSVADTLRAHPEEAREVFLAVMDQYPQILQLPELGRELTTFDMISLVLTGTMFLAEQKDQDLYPRLLKILLDKTYNPFEVFTDYLTEDMPTVLYTTFDGDMDRLIRYLDERQVWEPLMFPFFGCLAGLHEDGRISDSDWHDHLKRWLLLTLDAGKDYDFLAISCADEAFFLRYTDLYDIIRQLYDRRIIDLMHYLNYENHEQYMTRSNADRDYLPRSSFSMDQCLHFSDGTDLPAFLQETTAALNMMANFAVQQEKNREQARGEKEKKTSATEPNEPTVDPLEKIQAVAKDKDALKSMDKKRLKAMMNLPCPCGSGKKYKNCCYKKNA